MASNLGISIRRNDDGIVASGDLLAALPGGDVAVSAKMHLATNEPTGSMRFKLGPVAPSLLAQIDPIFAPLQALTMPVRLDAEAGFRKDGQWDNARLDIEAGAGTIALENIYPTPMAIENMQARLRADRQVGTIWLDNLNIVTDGVSLALQGEANRLADHDRLNMTLTASGLTPEKLVNLWPVAAAQNGREWVRDHLQGGIVENLNATLAVQSPIGQPLAASITQLEGRFAVKDVNVLYHPALPIIEKTSGTAILTANDLVFEKISGKTRDIDLSNVALRIDGFNAPDQNLVVEGDAKGPLRTVLTALNHPNFGYAKQIGLDPADISGISESHFRFAMPLINDLDIKDVDMLVTGKVTALNIDHAVAGLPISGGNLALNIDNNRMQARGRADIAGMALDVNWMQSFLKKDRISQHIAFKGIADASILGGLVGVDQPFLQGSIGLDGDYTELRNRGAELALNADIAGATLIWPDGMAPINPLEVVGQKLRIKANRAGNGLWVVPKLTLEGKDVAIAGRAYQGPTGGSEIILDQFRLGKTDLAVTWKQDGAGAVMVGITGRLFDLDPWLKTPPGATTEPTSVDEDIAVIPDESGPLDDALGFPISLSIMVDQMRMGGSLPWQQVAGQFSNDGER
jgi:hypothetical protein